MITANYVKYMRFFKSNKLKVMINIISNDHFEFDITGLNLNSIMNNKS